MYVIKLLKANNNNKNICCCNGVFVIELMYEGVAAFSFVDGWSSMCMNIKHKKSPEVYVKIQYTSNDTRLTVKICSKCTECSAKCEMLP